MFVCVCLPLVIRVHAHVCSCYSVINHCYVLIGCVALPLTARVDGIGFSSLLC